MLTFSFLFFSCFFRCCVFRIKKDTQRTMTPIRPIFSLWTPIWAYFVKKSIMPFFIYSLLLVNCLLLLLSTALGCNPSMFYPFLWLSIQPWLQSLDIFVCAKSLWNYIPAVISSNLFKCHQYSIPFPTCSFCLIIEWSLFHRLFKRVRELFRSKS